MKNLKRLLAKKKIQITIDDIGLYPSLDKYLLKSDLQHIDRLSLMISLANKKYFIRYKKIKDIALDIHLNSTVEKQMHNLNLLSIKGKYYFGRVNFVTKYILNKVNLKKVEADWTKQIELFVDVFAKTPDGLNSHEYLHFFPPFFAITLKLAKKYKIKFIRLGKEIPFELFEYRTWMLNVLQKLNYPKLLNSNLNTSSALYSLDWSKNSNYKTVSKLPDNSELILHLVFTKDMEFFQSLY